MEPRRFRRTRIFCPARAERTKFESFGFTEVGFCALLRAERNFLKLTASLFFILSDLGGPGAPEFFYPARARRIILKPTASPLFLSDLGGPSVGGCSAHAPEPPRAFLFLLEEKEAKDYLGGSPLKTPRGSALAASPLHPHGRKPLRYDITYQEPIGALPLPENFCALLDFLRIVQLPGKLFCLFQVRTVWKPRSITSPYFALTWQGVGHARGLTAQCLPWWIPERATRSAALCARPRRAHFRKCEGISEPVDPTNPSIGPQAHRVALLRAQLARTSLRRLGREART